MTDSRIEILIKKDRIKFIKDFNRIMDQGNCRYLFVASEEDTFADESAVILRGSGDLEGELVPSHQVKELADIMDANPKAALATFKRLFQFPNRISGVMFRVEAIDERIDEKYLYDYEAEFLLRVMRDKPFMINQGMSYVQGEIGDGNFRELNSIYDKSWYIESTRDFLIPLLKSYDKVPYLAQCYALYFLSCRLDANQNYNNRHVLDEQETEYYKSLMGQALEMIDDEMIMCVYKYPVYKRDFQFSRMLLRIKYEFLGKPMDEGLDLQVVKNVDGFNTQQFNEVVLGENADEELRFLQNVRYPALFLTCNGIPVYSTSNLRCNIQLMDIKDGYLEIDGSVPDIFDKSKVRYFFVSGGYQYEPQFCERYSLTKYFGLSAYKRYPFHVSIPISDILKGSGEDKLKFYVEYEDSRFGIFFEFKSHTSRLAAYPQNTYWHSGDFLLTTVKKKTSEKGFGISAIKISKYSWPKMAFKELGIGWELLSSLQSHRLHFFLLRAAWVVTHPFFGRKKIWLFFDKIYKGGDSSEYMYKYTVQKMKEGDPGAPDKAYYLLDETSADYKRLDEEGYIPLKRGSFLHRLVFLNADIVVVSNSTVFAFNDYYLENSRYIRGIPDFKVACVQHGLSVQKIALAQQRLRDNTKLYFLASEVEWENLMHPVYDYDGYDALRLTGIPRYDGLINEDKKQIMISPTWRMQSARLVSRHEGFERDYNTEFKETPYYKVYNDLINDERLINAAEKYGYRIAFVLHPIVSPQAGDFEGNDYVDIIPSVGDMSYEKLFRESSLMVTDYSGIQFDFAYMRKPLVYYHAEELEAHYEEGTYHYDTMAFGEIVRRKDELVSLLIDYMKEGCQMKELYRMRADRFFKFNDRENCKRVYEELANE